MGYSNQFFNILGIKTGIGGNLTKYSKETGIPSKKLNYYNKNNIFPSGNDLEIILRVSKLSENELMLSMGRLDKDVLEAIQNNAKEISKLIDSHKIKIESPQTKCKLKYETKLGKLYQGDAYTLLKSLKNDSVDLIFADPPFNLKKLYPSNIDDNLKTEKYIHWCQEWLNESIRVLKPGGSLLVWNLPKWNASLTNFLDGRLSFRHWISVDIKYSLPISGRLYPSHYSLLYYIKGEKPNVFHPDRMPMQTCPHCYSELKDYGGYKDKMNPKGINMTDVWTDISPVRHAKYKRREGANELSLKLLDRIIEMASNEGDLVLDPFGGSGTTYMAAELKNRRWVGCEIGPVTDILNRFENINLEREILNQYRENFNILFPKKVENKRKSLELWTCESIRNKKVVSIVGKNELTNRSS